MGSRCRRLWLPVRKPSRKSGLERNSPWRDRRKREPVLRAHRPIDRKEPLTLLLAGIYPAELFQRLITVAKVDVLFYVDLYRETALLRVPILLFLKIFETNISIWIHVAPADPAIDFLILE